MRIMNFERKCSAIALGLILISGGFVLTATASPNNNIHLSMTTTDDYLYVAIQTDIMTLNILSANDVWSSHVLQPIYDTTLKWDLNRTIKPWLVTNWSVSQDYKHWTVHYRTGSAADALGGPMYFHDGHEVTIDDILFTYEFLKDVPRWNVSLACLNWTRVTGISIGWAGSYVGVLASDDHTLRFNLNETYASFLTDTLNIIILPKHIWGNHWSDKLTWMDPLGDPNELVGSGPFEFTEWIQGQRVQLDRFDNYFDWTNTKDVDSNGQIIPDSKAFPWATAANRLPDIIGVKYVIKRTIDLAVIALKNWEVDYIDWPIPPSYTPDLIANPNVKFYTTTDQSPSSLVYNMRASRTHGALGYNDSGEDIGITFRRAVAHLVDTETIIKVGLQGYGKKAKGPISPDNKFWYNESLPDYTYSLEEAADILDSDPKFNPNYPYPFAGTWRPLPGIGTSQIEILAPLSDPVHYPTGECIASAMRSIGINATSRGLSFLDLSQKINNRAFDMVMFGWRIGSADPPNFLYGFYHSSQDLEGGEDISGFHNATVDAILEEYMSSANLTRRQYLIKWLQGILAELRPYEWLYFRDNIWATRCNRYTGWITYPDGIFNFWSLQLLHHPYQPLRVGISAISAIKSDEQTAVEVTISILSGSQEITVPGATVQIVVSRGYITPVVDNITDATGKVRYVFTGPMILPNEYPVNVTITAVAIKEGYDDGQRSRIITVYPADAKFLAVEMTAYSHLIFSGTQGQVQVIVRDQDRAEISGAYVNVSVDNPNGTILPISTQTNDYGLAMFNFTATVPIETTFVIVAIVSKNITYANSTSYCEIIVVVPPPQPPSEQINWVLIAVIGSIAVAVVACGGVLYTILKKRKKKAKNRTKSS